MSNALGGFFSRRSWTDSSKDLDIEGHKDSPRNLPQGWRTTPYVLGNEMTERVASFGLAWSLILYFTQEYHISKVNASYCLTVILGIIGLAPLFGGFVADAYLGRYRTIICGSLSNLVGMVWLSLTASLHSLRPAPCSREGSGPTICPPASKSHLGFLFSAFLFLAIGSGGVRPCSYPFGADQFGQTTIEEKKQLHSFFNLYYFVLTIALLLSATVIAYIQLDVSWACGFTVSAALMAMSIMIFLSGSSKYRYVAPTGSPFTDVAKVLVAAYRKRNLALPSDSSDLYVGDDKGSGGQSYADDHQTLSHTDQFRCLDKAAVIVDEDLKGGRSAVEKSWRLRAVDDVEQVKCVARVMPIWVSGIMASTNLAEQTMFVTLQAQAMDRHLIRSSSFRIPASSIAVVGFLAAIVWLPFYDRALVPFARKFSHDPVRGISLFQRVASGYILAVLSLVVAALVEGHRRSSSKIISVFWLVPQLVIFGIADASYIIGLVEFFYDQMPRSMRSVAGALLSCTIALGSLLGGILLAIVQTGSGRSAAHRRWIAENLSHGHLDYFYGLLAGLMGLNCVYFFVVASFYKPSRLQEAKDRTTLDESDLGTAMFDHSSMRADRHAVSKEFTSQANQMLDV